MVREVSDGIMRLTFALPWELDHVNAHLLRGPEGWISIDTGLGLPQTMGQWEAAIRELDAPIVRIIVTHFHPDHLGASALLAELSGAPVCQGELDHAVSRRVWGNPGWLDTLAVWYRSHGVPGAISDEVVTEDARMRSLVHWPRSPDLIHVGDRIDAAGEAWEVLHVPGHADGHLALFGTSTRRMLVGDHVLAAITPNVGCHPEGGADPLGDYLRSLRKVIELAPVVAFPGHHDTILDPVARAQEIIDHHDERLTATIAALGAGEKSAYDVSLAMFGTELSAHGRHFAVAETLAHLVRLELDELVERTTLDGVVAWRARPGAQASL